MEVFDWIGLLTIYLSGFGKKANCRNVSVPDRINEGLAFGLKKKSVAVQQICCCLMNFVIEEVEELLAAN
ncbi:hypothetical protein KIN20_004331 [Parelaphostrongylus tenuis]|uniref:Uncharacterized protein n=1 Tax=Parelaphostrongylus tenuis TaxID=148309 RepID=A0AAD5MH49_PARTN|nr:hypothetical protein KIN20_004331 [Parelaphostrongylus tenuis]